MAPTSRAEGVWSAPNDNLLKRSLHAQGGGYNSMGERTAMFLILLDFGIFELFFVSPSQDFSPVFQTYK